MEDPKLTAVEIQTPEMLASAINKAFSKYNAILADTATKGEMNQKYADLIIETKDILSQIKASGAEMETMKKELAKFLDVIKIQGESITTLKTAFDPKVKKMTLKDAITKALEDGAFKQVAEKKSSNASFTIDLKEIAMGGFYPSTTYQAGAAVQAYMPFQLPVYTPEEDFDIRTAVPTGTTESSKLEFPVELVYTDNMSAMLETAASALSDITFTMSTANAIRVSTHIKVSRTALKNVSWLANHISTRLMGKFVKYLNTQVITGPGTTIYLKGMEHYTNAFAAGTLAGTMPYANWVDVLLAARAINYSTQKIKPNVAFVNPLDAVVLTAIKSTTGEWANKEPFMTINAQGVVSVMGMAIVESFDITAGSYILAAVSAQNMELLFNGPIEIISSDSDGTDFLKNLVTIKLEADVMFPVYREGAIMQGTFVADQAALVGGI